MAWTKSASRYAANWVNVTDADLGRSAILFFRDGVIGGVIWGVLIASIHGLPTDKIKDAYSDRIDMQDRVRAAMEQAAKDKAEICGKHPQNLMCRPSQSRGKGDFSQLK